MVAEGNVGVVLSVFVDFQVRCLFAVEMNELLFSPVSMPLKLRRSQLRKLEESAQTKLSRLKECGSEEVFLFGF